MKNTQQYFPPKGSLKANSQRKQRGGLECYGYTILFGTVNKRKQNTAGAGDRLEKKQDNLNY